MKIKNKLATYHKLIHAKIIERTQSHSGFSNYVVNIMIDSMGARRGGQEGALAPPPPGNSKIWGPPKDNLTRKKL